MKVIYDQSYLTQKAIFTIEKALLEGIILISIAMLFYLGNIRAAFLVVLSIPLTLLMAFIFMKNFDIGGNLMSLAYWNRAFYRCDGCGCRKYLQTFT